MAVPETVYREHIEHWSAERDQQQRRSDLHGNVSLALILIAFVLFGLWLWQSTVLLLVGAGVFALGFAISFTRHGGVNRALRRARELVAIGEEGLARLERNWARIPLYDATPADPTHAYAADLDLLGRASLEHLLHTPTTPAGRATLRGWLLAGADPATIQARQAAVAELAPQIELREDVAFRGRQMLGSQPTYERFLAWAESEPWLLRRPWLVWLSRLLAVAALGLLVARLANMPVGLPLGVVLVLNLLVYFATARIAEERIERVAQHQRVFIAYADMFERITEASFESGELVQIQRDFAASGMRADRQMRRLARVMPFAEVRKWMFFFPIQISTLWSLHVLWALERWQTEAGPHARRWLVVLGEFEALAALATLAFDNPNWVFPQPSTDARISAGNLGHPLLPPTVAVGNDLEVGPPGTMLLVTGSNMSGKSTLLRAIGLNVVLAQAGGPVCATTMHVPPVALATSMRVRDSLEQGVSYFMAELQRLKFVVDQAEAERDAGERTLLFLLDEILHGTNSAERLVAARAILRYLLDQGAIGAVSSHDLALADTPDLATSSTLVHFSEQFSRGPDGPAMSFDYRLKPGLAKTTNALKLMELIGLPAVVLADGRR